MGPQRAASRDHAVAEGRQGGRDRNADRGGDVGQARPRGRMEAVDGLARSHRRPGPIDPGRDDGGDRSRTDCRTGRRRCGCSGIASRFGLGGDTVARLLLDGTPRIALDAARGGLQPGFTGVSITPYMLAAGEERIIADRLAGLLSKPPSQPAQAPPATPAADLSGQWTVRIQYRRGRLDAHAPPHAARQRPRRPAPGRVHDARDHRQHRRRRGADPQRLRRAAWRRGQPHVCRQGVAATRWRGRSTWASICRATWTASRRDGWRG